MGHLLFLALFAVVVLALVASLVINARQFFQLRTSKARFRSCNRGWSVQAAKSAMPSSPASATSPASSTAIAARSATNARSTPSPGATWARTCRCCRRSVATPSPQVGPQALVVLAGIRLRMIVGKLVLSQSPGAPPALVAGMEQLLGRLRSFSGLQGMYFDFYQGHLMAVKPPREEERKWPDQQLAEMTAADTETEAKQLLALMHPPTAN